MAKAQTKQSVENTEERVAEGVVRAEEKATGSVINTGIISVYISSTGTFTTADLIGELLDIGEVASSRDEVEVTRVGDKAKRYAAGLEDNGTQNLKFDVSEEVLTKVRGWYSSGKELHIGIAFEEPATYLNMTLVGVMKSFKIEGLTPGGHIALSSEFRNSKVIPSFTVPNGA